MAGKQSLYEKQLQQIVDVMGTDLLKKMTPEERMDGLTFDEILAVLSQEDLQNLEPGCENGIPAVIGPVKWNTAGIESKRTVFGCRKGIIVHPFFSKCQIKSGTEPFSSRRGNLVPTVHVLR